MLAILAAMTMAPSAIEFRSAAERCALDVRSRGEGGRVPKARYDAASGTLVVISSQDPQRRDCLIRWGEANRVRVLISSE